MLVLLTVRRFFICSTFQCQVEFLTEPRRCTRPTVWKIRGTKRDAETEASFFSTFIKILASLLCFLSYFCRRVSRIFSLSPLSPFLAAIPFTLFPLGAILSSRWWPARASLFQRRPVFISCRLKGEQTAPTINKLRRIVFLYHRFRSFSSFPLPLSRPRNEKISPCGKHATLMQSIISVSLVNHANKSDDLHLRDISKATTILT